MSSRYYPFDLARSICVIWIVGFWHILNYFPPESRLAGISSSVGYSITTGVLACFTFLSGYFLKKYDFNCWREVKGFYFKRLIRFYPLFVLSVALSVMSGYELRQGLYAIIGLSLFTPPALGTLWYFSMLLFFYVLTPFLKLRTTETAKMSLNATYILFIVVVLIVLIGGYFVADRRLVLYFPFYVIGLNLPNRIVEKSLNVYSLIGSIIGFFLLTLLNSDQIVFLLIKAFLGMMAFLSLSKLLYSNRIQRPVTFISYASMCAYLFHRPFYSFFLNVLHFFNRQYMNVFFAIVALIMIFALAYYIQKTYDILIKRITK